METSRLNPDNVRIGENLRAALDKINDSLPADIDGKRKLLTWRHIASAVPIHHVTLSKAVAGTRGLTEAKIIQLAGLLHVHPGYLIAGISERARTDRFPHIPSPTNRNKRDTVRKGMSVSSVEALVKNPAILSSFFGGIPKDKITWFAEQLLALRQAAIDARKAAH